MTTTPDPKTVREIARDCVADYIDDARDIAAHVMGHFGMGVPGDVYAWTDAVRTDLRAVVPSWPDEQQQDATDPARLAEIRARSRRLAAIALDVSPGDNCVVTDLVESASDVRWLLERLEQPQEFECEVCTKPITAYPCILCEHEPDPWKKPAEQPQDKRTATAAPISEEIAPADLLRLHVNEYAHAEYLAVPRHAVRAVLDERDALRKQHTAALESTAKAVAMLSDTYRERAFLVAHLAAEYPSVWAPDPAAGPGWNVVYVDLPTGQASWRISAADWDLFGFVPQGDIGIWDRHTTVEKYKRIFDLTMNIHLRKMTAEQPQDDGDVRAVAALLDEYRGGGTIAECKREFNVLAARFADRIAALDARGTQDGRSATETA